MGFLRRKIEKLLHIKKNDAVYNINYDALGGQKRVAVVYITRILSQQLNVNEIRHVNILHAFQMIKVLIGQGYAIDLYPCASYTPDSLKYNHYNIILGFGQNYIKLCALNPCALKILFVTENAPWTVKDNFSQRLSYYKTRHGKVPYTLLRTQFYNKEMFDISDVGIIMTGIYNFKGMQSCFKNAFRINVNALFNPDINKCPTKDFTSLKTNFVWFGSNGLIHKGLDVLIDSFSQLPNYCLNVYGAPEKEIKGFSIPENVIIHKSVNVFSKEFIDKVINQNVFVVSLSCSEGMMSGVATCMVHGLIPITTRETGFDDVSGNITFDSFEIKDVVDVIIKAANMKGEELQALSTKIFEYSRKEYSLKKFESSFSQIMSEVNKIE